MRPLEAPAVPEVTEGQALLLRSAGRGKPTLWIQEIFNCLLHPLQAQIAESVMKNPRTAVRSCSNSGKSFDAARIALCFLFNYRPSIVITTAPTFRQVESILWREIATAHGSATIKLDGSPKQVGLNLAKDHFAIGLSTDEPERFQGLHSPHILVIADEASGLSEEVYAAIENPLSGGFTRLLLIGNPTRPTGSFRDAFNSPLYKKFHISAFDTPNFTEFNILIEDIRTGAWKDKVGELPYPSLIDPQWVAERFSEWGEGSSLFQVYVLGDFPEAGVNNLFRLSDVEAAMERDLPVGDTKVSAVDVARYGEDFSVFGTRIGNKVFSMKPWSHSKAPESAGRIIREMRLQKPYITVIDAVALGDDVADIVEEDGESLVRFYSGANAIDKVVFGNARAEEYWKLNRKFEEGTIDIPKDDILKAQLLDIRFRYDGKGRYFIESKEEARARGSKSPDRADTLMMLFARAANHKGGPPQTKDYY
ncbi:hypothetical protein LCGC14_0430970 [marine sediment metagenome]|uniref:Terminase large subunit gp17-like C-terminal domain-containing protein n=1 Tax=marine sediment metagenome TaxID=412755 RepID=A0A0F9T697_9ZZZZ